MLDSLIAGATDFVQQQTGPQLVVAAFDYFRDSFRHGCLEGIRLPISPLHEVEGVFYVSPDVGMEVELPDTVS